MLNLNLWYFLQSHIDLKDGDLRVSGLQLQTKNTGTGDRNSLKIPDDLVPGTFPQPKVKGSSRELLIVVIDKQLSTGFRLALTVPIQKSHCSQAGKKYGKTPGHYFF